MKYIGYKNNGYIFDNSVLGILENSYLIFFKIDNQWYYQYCNKNGRVRSKYKLSVMSDNILNILTTMERKEKLRKLLS